MLGDRLFSSGVGSSRSCALGRSGAACTAHPLATLTAYDVLRGGGNSLDAAIAANAMLGVVEPTGCGVGGDLFAIVRTADGSVHGLNASGRSSSAMTVEQMRAASGTVPAYGPLSVTVPGCVDGCVVRACAPSYLMCLAGGKRFTSASGRSLWIASSGARPIRVSPYARLVVHFARPAIECARNGFPVSEGAQSAQFGC